MVYLFWLIIAGICVYAAWKVTTKNRSDELEPGDKDGSLYVATVALFILGAVCSYYYDPEGLNHAKTRSDTQTVLWLSRIFLAGFFILLSISAGRLINWLTQEK